MESNCSINLFLLASFLIFLHDFLAYQVNVLFDFLGGHASTPPQVLLFRTVVLLDAFRIGSGHLSIMIFDFEDGISRRLLNFHDRI